MKKILVITSALLFTCAAASAHADSATYTVSVDTSSQAGNNGYVDFELNSGTFGAADITATVSGFSGATLIPGDPNNDAINTVGTLPGDVTFDNQTGNDYFEALTFGNSVSFDVTLSGAGLSTSGSAGSLSGTDFEVSFLDPSMSTFLFSNGDPAAAVIEVAADGTPTTEAESGTVVAAPTPEPATLSLLALGGVLMGAERWRKRQAA